VADAASGALVHDASGAGAALAARYRQISALALRGWQIAGRCPILRMILFLGPQRGFVSGVFFSGWQERGVRAIFP